MLFKPGGDGAGILRAAAVAIGLLALGVVGAAATTFEEEELTCPIGGQTFKAMVMASTFSTGQRLDLKPVGGPSFGMLLPVCPDNGFVMYKMKFSDEEVRTLTPIVLSDEYQRLRAENARLFLVAYMHERMGADDEMLALLYLQASWEAEFERPQLVGRYRTLALEKLDRALGSDQTSDLVLLAAELERLLGRFDAAEARLSAVPVGSLDAAQSTRLEQIRKHVQRRNAEPQPFAAEQ
jgi:hypothetical protein